jgi:hypothetical protein
MEELCFLSGPCRGFKSEKRFRRASTAIHGPSGLKFHPSEKANATADCLENQFTHHDLCDENHERQVEARVQALLKVVDNKPLEKIRPCDLQKLINSLKLRKACGIDGIPNECLRHLPRSVGTLDAFI